jgi:hypothetical protein
MSSAPLPPRPGPAPPDFHFPFAEAARALDAIEDLIDDIASMVSRHRSAAVSARVGFEGRARREFDAAFESLMSDFDDARTNLANDAAVLDAAIQTARVRQRQARDAIAAHQRAVVTYQRAVDAQRAAARAR